MSAAFNICLIEDNQEMVDSLKTYLEAANYKVSTYLSAEDFFKNKNKDFKGLYLVDWNLPGESGLDIIGRIREEDKMSPIFMISAYNKEEEVVQGLKSGADDYITKPFNFEQLLVKVENAASKFELLNNQLDFSGIKLLPKASAFIKDGNTVNLTLREYVIFDKLYKEANGAVTREELIACFSKDDKMTLRNIDVHVFSLRKKIKDANITIDTVRGIGYKISIQN